MASRKVLVVDDDLVQLKIIQKSVQACGATSVLCSNGERALHVIEDNPDIDLIISDYVMPRISGKELVSSVRSNYSEAQLPIILVSGLVRVGEIKETLDMGVRYFVPKPFEGKILRDYINRCFSMGEEGK